VRLDVERERRHGRSLAHRCLAVAAAAWLALAAGLARAEEWQPVYRDDVLEVEARARAGSAVKELRARGTLPAPPHVVRAVVAAVDRYPDFMPYVKESLTLGVEGAVTTVYQRLAFGLIGISDRDYVIDITETVEADSQGRDVYVRRWRVGDSARVPEQPSAVRLSVNRGSWRLAAAEAPPDATRAVYCLFTDPGGSLPAFVVNQANTVAIRKVFAAVSTAARDPRYAAAARPPVAGGGPPRAAPGDGLCED
jgi:Polyketide cyclase / dehydrase and lipid transport